MIETFIFIIGAAVGSYITAKILTHRAKRVMIKRGKALRKITHHQWNTGRENDAVVITRIAMDGLKYE